MICKEKENALNSTKLTGDLCLDANLEIYQAKMAAQHQWPEARIKKKKKEERIKFTSSAQNLETFLSRKYLWFAWQNRIQRPWRVRSRRFSRNPLPELSTDLRNLKRDTHGSSSTRPSECCQKRTMRDPELKKRRKHFASECEIETLWARSGEDRKTTRSERKGEESKTYRSANSETAMDFQAQ